MTLAFSKIAATSVMVFAAAGGHSATLAPLPSFRECPHLDATEVRSGDLSLVTISARDRDGVLCPAVTNWVVVVPQSKTGCDVIGVGRVGDAVAQLNRTNAVQLSGGEALVAIRRSMSSQKLPGYVRFEPEGEGLVGFNYLLRKYADVKGVWVRDAHGGASYEVPASLVTNDFEVSLGSIKTYNLFSDSQEPLAVTVTYRNTGKKSRSVRIGCHVCDWDGKTVLSEEKAADSVGGDEHTGRIVFDPKEERGFYFIEAYVMDADNGKELAFSRTTAARLPPHDFKSTAKDSIFGLASWSDEPDIETMQRLIDRLGVRWMRRGDVRTQHSGRAVNYQNSFNWRTCMWPEESRDNWVRAQVEYCVTHGAKRFEFGNEMNLAVATIGGSTDGIGLCHFASNYVSWVKTFDRVMKANGYDRQVDLLGFGMAGFDHAFATKMREGGILPMLKGFCIHPPTSQFTPDYPYEQPERPMGRHPGDYPNVGADKGHYWNCLGAIRAARDYLDRYAPGMPLWVTEMYSPSKANYKWGASMRDGADNVVLEYALMKAEGVKVGLYWQLCDGRANDMYGINQNDLEYHFGLLNRDLSLKPAAMGYCAIAEALDEAAFAGWMKMADSRTHGLLFKTPRGPMAVLWARWDGMLVTWQDQDGVCRHKEPWQDRWPTKKSVSLPTKGKAIRIDSIGRGREVKSHEGMADVLLDGSPCIVYGLNDALLQTY